MFEFDTLERQLDAANGLLAGYCHKPIEEVRDWYWGGSSRWWGSDDGAIRYDLNYLLHGNPDRPVNIMLSVRQVGHLWMITPNGHGIYQPVQTEVSLPGWPLGACLPLVSLRFQNGRFVETQRFRGASLLH